MKWGILDVATAGRGLSLGKLAQASDFHKASNLAEVSGPLRAPNHRILGFRPGRGLNGHKAGAGFPTLAATLTTIHEYHPRAFVMVNVDSSTPRLKVAKKWLDAFSSRDASRLGPLLSKNYKNHTFPPEETKEEHIRRYRPDDRARSMYPTPENRLRARRLISTTPSSMFVK
jgi:hypothetical protein